MDPSPFDSKLVLVFIHGFPLTSYDLRCQPTSNQKATTSSS
uniref:Putative alpha/beta-hydrolase n=1 Tax=Moniliophthora roreri TaxID=221103 RepID=A0A0W0EV25_MONRR